MCRIPLVANIKCDVKTVQIAGRILQERKKTIGSARIKTGKCVVERVLRRNWFADLFFFIFDVSLRSEKLLSGSFFLSRARLGRRGY